MIESFEEIKSIGFDLDNTLYKNNLEIDRRISDEVARKVLELKPEIGSLEKSIEICNDLYGKYGSRTQSLKELGFENSGEIVTSCMEQVDFADLILPDSEVVQLMREIREKYDTFLITSTITRLAAPRLERIGINQDLFDILLFGDSAMPNKKIDGSIFSYFLGMSPYLPREHLYIGDNLKADIIPAKSLGMKTIAIGKVNQADYCIDKIYDIRNLLL